MTGVDVDRVIVILHPPILNVKMLLANVLAKRAQLVEDVIGAHLDTGIIRRMGVKVQYLHFNVSFQSYLVF